nr:MAG TPA: hypothetical protein [Herelleviridae sp.]
MGYFLKRKINPILANFYLQLIQTYYSDIDNRFLMPL